jgi:hypothetical protein
MPRKPFTGPLAEPIAIADDLDPDERDRQIMLARMAKLPLLAQHYEVDLSEPDGWMTLALRMAADFAGVAPGTSAKTLANRAAKARASARRKASAH